MNELLKFELVDLSLITEIRQNSCPNCGGCGGHEGGCNGGGCGGSHGNCNGKPGLPG